MSVVKSDSKVDLVKYDKLLLINLQTFNSEVKYKSMWYLI